NFILMAFTYITWFLWHPFNLLAFDEVDSFILGSCIALFVGSLIFMLLVNQTLLLLPRKKNWLWFGAIASISCLVFPALTSVMAILLLSVRPTSSFLGMAPETAIFAIPTSLMATTIMALAFIHTRQIILVGRSDTQGLLRGTDLSQASMASGGVEG
ncbi:MAG: hypothetical protein AAFY20_20305, partial [Cyanobacteria bacterium J06639_14]